MYDPEFAVPDDEGMFEDACAMLETIYQSFLNLDRIPYSGWILGGNPGGIAWDNWGEVGSGNVHSNFLTTNACQVSAYTHARTRSSLKQYGWPDHFRKDEWLAYMEGKLGVWYQEGVDGKEREDEKKYLDMQASKNDVRAYMGRAALPEGVMPFLI
jgi:hypothetical protein